MSGDLRFLVRTSRRAIVGIGALAAAAALALAGPPDAAATVTCTYNGAAEVLQVTMDANGDGATFAVAPGGAIQVRGGGPVLVCAGGSPTTANTDFVTVTDSSDDAGLPGATDGSTTVSINTAAAFAPTTAFIIGLNAGSSDRLQVGSTGHLVLGKTQLNFNADEASPVVDATLLTAVDEIALGGGAGPDVFSAQGGFGTGAAFDGAADVSIDTETGDDLVTGSNGSAGDLLNGGSGDDIVRGFDGADLLIGDGLAPGDDTLIGGSGSDRVQFALAQKGLTVDLNEIVTQDTGQGLDRITEVENVDGSPFADTLIGDAGPNQLRGMGGDDLLDGRGGADDIQGSGVGDETVTYATAPAGVAVDLGAGTVTGGDTDALMNIDNVIGSPFADSLTGNANANRIVALGGNDSVSALGGADLVDVRDAGPDTAACGTELDTAIADRRGVDTIGADCESVSFLPDLPAPGNPPQPAVDGTLLLRLSGARKQRLLKQKAVVVKVRCPDEACAAVTRASGKLPKLPRPRLVATALTRLRLKSMTTLLQPGPAKTLRLRLTKKQRAAIRLRLATGKKPKVKVTVRATDAAGNVARRSLTVTAKR